MAKNGTGPGGFIVRGLFIALIANLALFRYAFGRAAQIAIRDESVRRSRMWALRGRILRWAMESLGATFIKLGQVMSTRPDVFPPELIAELRKLQDRLPPFEGARLVIERELGRPIVECFRELEDAPVAAASVAQVHRGVLPDGTEVAVKVLRPDVREKALRDGRILMFWARALEFLSKRARHSQPATHLSHFVDGIVAQTDLRLEAQNYEKFRANFARMKKVRFPKVFPELSGERVMTMEFVRGDKVDVIPRERLPKNFPRRLREVFFQMCFDDGFLHVDLHPGNFVVEADGTLTIFDVGLAKELSPDFLEQYIDFNRCLVMGDAQDTMRHLRKYHRYIEDQVDWVEFERDIARFSADWRSRKVREIEFGDLTAQIFAMGRKHGVRPVPEMTLMIVGLVTAEGLGKQLDPDVNSFQEVANYLVPVLARRNMLSPELMAQMASRMVDDESPSA